MGKNTFFEPNHELCATFQSVSFFNYKGLKCKGKGSNKKYPIYLFVSSDSLNFLFHLGEEGEDGEHQHNYLFEISLGSVEEGLADVYRGDIAFTQDTLLNRTIKYAYLRKTVDVRKGVTFSDLQQVDLKYPEEFIKEQSSKLLEQINCFDYKRIVDVLTIENQNIDDEIKEEARKIKWEEYSYPLYRKVFLDFMFDFEINNTFKDLPHYNQIKKELHANATYKALYTKLKFYYLRKQVEENVDTGIVLRKLEELVNVEADWINIIKKTDSEGLFHYSKWFSDIESEAMGIYTPKDSRVNLLIKNTEKEEITNAKNVEKEVELQKLFNDLANKDKECTTFLFNRLLQKYNVKSVLEIGANKSLKYYECIKWFILLFFLVHFISPIWADRILFSMGILVTAAIASVIGIRSINYPLNLSLLYPRFFIAICSAWILIGLNADLFKTFAYIELSGFYYFIGSIVVLVISVFIYREVRKMNNFSSGIECLKRTVTILSLGLLYSFLIGMIMFSFVGQKFIGNDESLTKFYKEKLPNSGFVVVDDPTPDLKEKIDLEKEMRCWVVMDSKEHWDGLEQICKNGYPIKTQLYPCIKGNFSFTYFPVFFYILVFLALFIGVFIELLANDRKVADPL